MGNRTLFPFPDARAWRVPTIFSWLQREGRLSEEEMARTFNCGVGAALVVSEDLAEQVLRDVRQHQEEAWLIGRVVARPEGSRSLFGSSACNPECICPTSHAVRSPLAPASLWPRCNLTATR